MLFVTIILSVLLNYGLTENSHVYFRETFDDTQSFKEKWISSLSSLSHSPNILYKGKWNHIESSGEKGDTDFALKITDAPNQFALSSLLNKPFIFDKDSFIFQYEFKIPSSLQCGGAYIKLLSVSPRNQNLSEFRDDSPYTIMFGPDKCGNIKKFHFIFKHKNPKTNEYEEKHLTRIDEKMIDHIFTDNKFHQIQLILKPDNTFKILLDKKIIKSGSLFDSFTPAVNPPAEIDDPEDKEPEDWDNTEQIPDPNAVKPKDWDETAPRLITDKKAKMPTTWKPDTPKLIPNPNSIRPQDWNDEEDGEWQPELIANPECEKDNCGKWDPPQIPNPAYKGPWSAPLIKNPNYKGPYKPRKIPNPNYFFDENPFKMATISALGFELWSVNSDIMFDNILLTSSIELAKEFSRKTYDNKLTKQRIHSLKNIHKSPYFIPALIVVALAVLIVVIYMIFMKTSSSVDLEAKSKKSDPEIDETSVSNKEESSSENPDGENIRKRETNTPQEE